MHTFNASAKPKTEDEYVQFATKSLQELSNLGVPVETFIKRSKGIAFFCIAKTSLIASIEHGYGFVIKLLSEGSYSGPVFLRVHSLGLGLSLTSGETKTVMFLPDDESVENLVRDQVKLGVEFQANSLKYTHHGDAKLSSSPWRTGEHFNGVFNLTAGRLVDVSISGGMVTVDHPSIKRCYGEEATVKLILAGDNGKAPKPWSFAPFYSRLTALSHQSDAQPAAQ